MRKRLPVLFLTAVLCLLAALPFTAKAVGAMKPATPVFPGDSSGSANAGSLNVKAGSGIVNVGPLFPVSVGCVSASRLSTASAASGNLGVFANLGALTDSVNVMRSATVAEAKSSSTVAAVNILGLITADQVRAVADTKATAGGVVSANTSVFTNLVIGGTTFNGAIAPNTTLTLSGPGGSAIATVILNEQTPSDPDHASSLAVKAIDIKITASNSFGLPVGARIIVASVKTGFTSTAVPAFVRARAYGLLVKAILPGSSITSGPYASVSIPCSGGARNANTLNVSLPGLASAKTITDTASGNITDSDLTASSTSQTQTLSLLGGSVGHILTVDVITANATAQSDSSGNTVSGSTTLGEILLDGVPLTINGKPITGAVPANTSLTLPFGLGKLVLNEQTTSIAANKALIIVNALHLNVSIPAVLTADIVVGHTEAGFSRY